MLQNLSSRLETMKQTIIGTFEVPTQMYLYYSVCGSKEATCFDLGKVNIKVTQILKEHTVEGNVQATVSLGMLQ